MYQIGDKVIFKYYESNQVGQVVEVHRRKNSRTTYDVMSEKGSLYIHTPVDTEKLNQYIDSALTSKLIDSGEIISNLKVGWNGNYAPGVTPTAFWLSDSDSSQTLPILTPPDRLVEEDAESVQELSEDDMIVQMTLNSKYNPYDEGTEDGDE